MAVGLNMLLAVLVLFACLSHVMSIQCYECNVWKAGYGQLCDNPKIRKDCKVCMKVVTDSYIMRYSDTPRHSQIVSRVCGNYEMTHFGVECHYYTAADGGSTRCYCDTDLCNSSPKQQAQVSFLSLSIVGLVSWMISRIFSC